MINWQAGPKYVPCDNPFVKSMMEHTSQQRYLPQTEFTTFKRYGKTYCAWCNFKETPTNRHKYCSEECRISCEMFCYPTKYYGFNYLFYMQRGHCQTCDYDFTQHYFNNPSFYEPRKQDLIDNKFISFYRIKYFVPKERYMEIDHIIPVCHGGSILGHDNLQLICKVCHKFKTKRDIKLKKK